MKNAIKKLSAVLLVIVILASGTFGYKYFTRKKEPAYNFVIAEKDTLIQEVSVTGRVKPAASVDLAFEKAGKVVKVNTQIGDKVTTTQTLIELDNADIKAQLDQAMAGVESAKAQLNQYQATLETQQAKLNELKKGTRPEEIKIAETKVANAKNVLSDAQKNLADAENKAEAELTKAKQAEIDDETNLTNINDKASNDLKALYDDVKNILYDSYSKADDAVFNKTSGMFLSNGYSISFYTSNAQAKNDAESKKYQANDDLKKFNSLINNLSSDYSSLDKALAEADGYLSNIKNLLERLNDVLSDSVGIASAILSTYQTNMYTARTNINTALNNINDQEADIISQKQTNQNNIDTAQAELNASQAASTLQETTNQSNISAAKGNVNSAQNALNTAEDELTLKKAGSTAEQIAAQEALVKQAQANIASQAAKIKETEANYKNFEAQLEKTVIRSPIDGIVTALEIKIGEIVSPNVKIISLISASQFEVEAFVPEADIAKVKINDTAKTTLDAYGNDIQFETKVIKIEPAETMIEGVATYKTILQFAQSDERVKSGMTTNLDILTNKLENIIAIPGRAVIVSNGDKLARIFQNGKIIEVKITTGIRGSDGRVEITSGINEGDKVVTFTEEK